MLPPSATDHRALTAERHDLPKTLKGSRALPPYLGRGGVPCATRLHSPHSITVRRLKRFARWPYKPAMPKSGENCSRWRRRWTTWLPNWRDSPRSEGDLDGAAVWRRILHAVEELPRMEPRVGESVN